MKSFKKINTNRAPQAIGPYSQAIVSGQLIFTSGQIAIDPATNLLIEGDIFAQTSQVIKNLQSVLEKAGSNLNKVLKTTVYLANLDDFASMNEIYSQFFINQPARATVEVARLPKDALIEIDCLAIVIN